MQSRNSYSGVDPIIVKNVKYRAKCVKRYRCFAHDSLCDIEQELFCSIWPSINKYRKDKGCFAAYVSQLTKCRSINLINKRLCIKRGGRAGILFIDSTTLDNMIGKKCFSENEITTQIDIEDVISKLPEKWQIICEQLKTLNVKEVAKVNEMSRTTIYSILKKIKQRVQKTP
ncbi:MAG: sigma-70 family RNA polymerase sigma factor [Wolbachia sp.]